MIATETTKEFILDNTLTSTPLEAPQTPYKYNTEEKNEEQLIDNVTSIYRHRNYLSYLAKAWNNHYGVVITPDILWYMVLCEIAAEVKKDPEQFRDLFTTSKEKIEVSIQTFEPVDMPLDDLLALLVTYIPTDSGKFLPKFSTSTYMSEFAFYAAFADMVSPYYNYSMYLCGIPKIRIEGVEDDWVKMYNTLGELANVLPQFSHYFTRVAAIAVSLLNCITTPDIDFLKNIFRLEQCGSGHQEEVEGWITDMFMEKPQPGYIGNYSSHVSVVKYKNLSTNKNYKKYVGLFGSDIKDGYLVPDFGYYVTEVKS